MASISRVHESISAVEDKVNGHFENLRLLRKEKENLGGFHINITHKETPIVPVEPVDAPPASVAENRVLFNKLSGGNVVPVYPRDIYKKSGSVVPYASVMYEPYSLTVEQIDAIISDKQVQEHAFPPRLEQLKKIRTEKLAQMSNSKKSRK